MASLSELANTLASLSASMFLAHKFSAILVNPLKSVKSILAFSFYIKKYDFQGFVHLLLFSYYKSVRGKYNSYLRVHVKTEWGAPARGASVTILTNNYNILWIKCLIGILDELNSKLR